MAVRRERVVLELEDRFTSGIARAAAATALYKEELRRLSGTNVSATRTGSDLERQTDRVSDSMNRGGSELDRFTGRAKLLANVAGSLGPSLVPIGAVGIPAITGLASSLGFAAVAGGVTMLAFQGLGDAVKAMNDAALDPTDAKLEKVRQTMSRLSPEAAGFARELYNLRPILDELRRSAGAGLFPGLTDAANDLQVVFPKLEGFMRTIGVATGRIAADVTGSLASGEWDDFLQFLETEGPRALGDFATAIGNTTHGLAELWMATTPLNQDFSAWLIKVTDDFDKWSTGLSKTEGFHEFVAYIETNGPQVAETFGAIGNAVLQIVEAAAPLGGPVLRIIESLADALATIADSPVGTPLMAMVTAMSTLRLATGAQAAIQDKTWGSPSVAKVRAFAGAITSVTSAQQRATMTAAELAAVEQRRSQVVSGGLRTMGRGAATLGLLAVASTGLADKFGLANTASLALAGSMAGPWGAAVGAGVGLVLDFAAAHKKSDEAVKDFMQTLDQETGAFTESTRQWAANRLMQKGVLDQAQDLGLALNTVTDAALGQGDALDSLNTQLDAIIKKGSPKPIDLTDPNAQFDLPSGAQQQAAFEARRLKDALNDTNGVVDKGIEKQKLLSAATQQTVDPLKQQKAASLAVAAAAERQRKAQQALVESSQKVASEFLDFSKNADNAKVSLHDFIREMENQAAALEQFGKNAIKAGKRGLNDGLIKYLESLGPVGALRMKQLANATDAQIKRANAAWWAGRRAAKDYGIAVGAIPNPKLKVDGADTMAAKLRKIKQEMDGIKDKSVSLNLYVHQTNAINKLNAMQDAYGRADGGTVPGQRTPYGDKVLIHAAPGEEVITNRRGEADRFRADRAAGRIPAYADGGTVSGHRAMHDWLSPGRDAWSQVLAAIAKSFKFDIPNSLNDWKHALDRSQKAIDNERQKRDDLVQKQSELVSAVAEKLRSDLFTTGSSSNLSVWLSAKQRQKAGTGDVFSTLRGDISNATAFKKALASLKKKGLDGAAFEEVARSGDLNQVQALAAMSSTNVRKFEWLFNRRQQLTQGVGSFAGSTVYGADIKEQNGHLRALVEANHRIAHRLNQLEKLAEKNPKAVGDEVGKSMKAIGGRK